MREYPGVSLRDQTDSSDEEEIFHHPFNKAKSEISDVRFDKAVQRILRFGMGLIPMEVLQEQIDVDAANLLVEHCILVYHPNLFTESVDWESNGYVKEMPENINIDFMGRLARFGLPWQVWQSTAQLPDTWKSRLSSRGIRALRCMPVYCKQLGPPFDQPIVPNGYEQGSDEEGGMNCSPVAPGRPSNKRLLTDATSGNYS